PGLRRDAPAGDRNRLSIHLFARLLVHDGVESPLEEPTLPGAADQRIGAAVVVDGDAPGQSVRAVEPTAVAEVVYPSGVRVGRLPLGGDRLQGQVVGEAADVVVGGAADKDRAARAGGDRVGAPVTDEDAEPGPPGDGIAGRAADQDIA